MRLCFDDLDQIAKDRAYCYYKIANANVVQLRIEYSDIYEHALYFQNVGNICVSIGPNNGTPSINYYNSGTDTVTITSYNNKSIIYNLVARRRVTILSNSPLNIDSVQ